MLFLSLSAFAQNNIYDFVVKDNKGNDVSLSKYKGKVVIIVNTATACGYTPQYGVLEELYPKYKDKGLEILDFPCNQFGAQAPGNDDEIENFCVTNYNTHYPRFAKVEVNGENEVPLFSYLKDKKNYVITPPKNNFSKISNITYVESKEDATGKPDVYWNFTKFLVNKKGKVVARLESKAGKESMEAVIKELMK